MSGLSLGERSEIVSAIWPPSNITDLVNRCAVVNDVATGHPTPSLSPVERERIVEEIARRVGLPTWSANCGTLPA